jgi:hypothetical protein
MFVPGHSNDHGSLVIMFDKQGMFFWANEEVDQVVEEVYPEAEIAAEVAPSLELPPSGRRVVPPYQEPVYAGRNDLAGRRRTRVHQYNVYSSFDEGIHSAVPWTGREIPRKPMQDELEWENA